MVSCSQRLYNSPDYHVDKTQIFLSRLPEDGDNMNDDRIFVHGHQASFGKVF